MGACRSKGFGRGEEDNPHQEFLEERATCPPPPHCNQLRTNERTFYDGPSELGLGGEVTPLFSRLSQVQVQFPFHERTRTSALRYCPVLALGN